MTLYMGLQKITPAISAPQQGSIGVNEIVFTSDNYPSGLDLIIHDQDNINLFPIEFHIFPLSNNKCLGYAIDGGDSISTVLYQDSEWISDYSESFNIEFYNSDESSTWFVEFIV